MKDNWSEERVEQPEHKKIWDFLHQQEVMSIHKSQSRAWAISQVAETEVLVGISFVYRVRQFSRTSKPLLESWFAGNNC